MVRSCSRHPGARAKGNRTRLRTIQRKALRRTMGSEGTTRLVPRSQLKRLLHQDSFLWCTGVEDTFVFEPHARTRRALDEYDLTGHYDRWEQDLRLMPDLGVSAARYGIPWYKVSPAPDKWDWSFAD